MMECIRFAVKSPSQASDPMPMDHLWGPLAAFALGWCLRPFFEEKEVRVAPCTCQCTCECLSKDTGSWWVAISLLDLYPCTDLEWDNRVLLAF